MIIPFFIEPPALVAQAPVVYQRVETQGQVRNSFTVNFPDGGSVHLIQGSHVWVKARIMQGGNQIGWLCVIHGKEFQARFNDVQIWGGR